MRTVDTLLNVNELADALGRHRWYVWRMKCKGFVMPGGRCTLEEARQWLRDNPQFKTTQDEEVEIYV